MSKSSTRLTAGFHDSGGTTADTASVSPVANSAVVVTVVSFDTATMSISGNGLTWATKVNGTDLGGGWRLWCFIGAGASPSSGAIQFTFDTDGFLDWVVDNVTGTVLMSAPSSSNVSTSQGTDGAPSLTLGAFAHASNGVWAFVYAQDDVTFTEGSGFSPVASRNGTALFGHSDFSMYQDANDTSVNASLSLAAVWYMVALEIVDTAPPGEGADTVAVSITTQPISVGPVTCGTGENNAGIGATAWSNPGTISIDNATDATCNAGASSQYLVARNFDFSSIPDDAVIVGVIAEPEASEHSSGTESLNAQLQDASGTLFGSSKSTTISGTGKSLYTYGSSTDVWGTTGLTGATVKDVDFGVRFWFTTSHDVRVDYVRMQIYWKPNPTPALGAALAITEGVDALAGEADVPRSASLVVTEGIDALAADATVSSSLSASLVVTEGIDTLAADADVIIAGSLIATEVVDGLAADADIVVSASLASVEASDTILADAGSNVVAALAVSEDVDTASFDVDVKVSASLALTEGVDAVSADVDVKVLGVLLVNEASDTVVVSAQLLSYIVVLTSLAPEGQRITALPDLEVGWWLEVGPVVTGGTITDVIVNDDGTFEVASGVTSFEVRAWDGLSWGDYGTQNVVDPASAFLAVTEGVDTAAFSASSRVTVVFAGVEFADALAGTTSVYVQAALSVSESADSLAAGTYTRNTALASLEAVDVASASVLVRVAAALVVQEAGADSFAAVTGVYSVASLAVAEERDEVAASADVHIGMAVSAVEGIDAAVVSTQLLSYLVVIASLADIGERITAIPDLQIGWILEVGPFVAGGTIVDVVVNQDGTFDVDADVTAFQVRAWDGASWGAYGTQYTSEGLGAIVSVVEGSDVAFATNLPPQFPDVIWLTGTYLDTVFLQGSIRE